jgi:3'(2'), 5'-bisphosphate nucleotidase
MNLHRHLLKSIQAALEAGNAILEIYCTAFEIEEKADRSPLTLADRRSHDIIAQHLMEFDLPLLSEEGRHIPYDERKAWDPFWLVDPLDGTKEFIKKNGEFTINIACIHQRRPVAGVIFVPDKNVLYFGSQETGAYRMDSSQIAGWLNSQSSERRADQQTGAKARVLQSSKRSSDQAVQHLMRLADKLPILDSTRQTITIVGSRSHATPELNAYVEERRQQYGQVQFISAGSALKFCLVAEGKANLYPRLGATMEWDTAAGQAIVESAGGRVLRYDTAAPLIYNKENLLNPWFVALAAK